MIELWRKRDNPEITVEAVRLNEDNIEAIASYWGVGDLVEEIDPEHPEEMQHGLNVTTPTGTKRASLNMYVVKYGGQFFVSHNRPFEMKYEPVNRPAPPLESAGDAARERGFADPFGGSSAG